MTTNTWYPLDVVTKALEGEDEPDNSENTVESHDEIVTGYKNLIMEQDVEITRLKSLLGQGLSVCLSVFLYLCMFVCLSVCISVCLSLTVRV